MAKLSRIESIQLVKLIVKGQNVLKGTALDMARQSFPTPGDGNDRQFEQFKKTLKDSESGLRTVMLSSLVQDGIIEPVSAEEIFNGKKS